MCGIMAFYWGYFLFFFFKILFIYLFIFERESISGRREREKQIPAEQGAQPATQFQDPEIMT